jgi:hypothetical protein
MHKTEDRFAPGDAEWRARLEGVLRQKQENDQQIAKLLEDLRGGVKLPQELRGGAQGAVRGVRARGPPMEQPTPGRGQSHAEERRAYRIPDFCWRYGISRSTTYALAKSGRLRLIKVNGRTLVLHEDAEALLREGA